MVKAKDPFFNSIILLWPLELMCSKLTLFVRYSFSLKIPLLKLIWPFEVSTPSSAELGVETSNGQISFSNGIFNENEYLTKRVNFEHINSKGHRSIIELKKGSFAFTICQTPIVYQRSRKSLIEITYSSGETEKITGLLLPQNISKKIFERDGAIKKIIVSFQN